MSWQQAVRAVNSSIKASNREALRREKQYNKMLEFERAKYQYDEFTEYLNKITTIHTEGSEPVDWQKVIDTDPPVEPQLLKTNELKARQNLKNYSPTFFDKLFNKAEAKKKDLSHTVEKAIKKDDADYNLRVSKFKQDVKNLREGKEFAAKVLAGDSKAYSEAIKELNPFSQISDIGASVSFSISDDSPLHARIKVNSEGIIPKEKVGILKSGKLSVKNMPKGEFYTLYQDYVCSSVLRIARELFAILPIYSVVVTAVDDLLNSSTGYIEEQAILSVAIPRKTFEGLNLEMIDPSDSMKNFVHNMNFRKTKGFSPVDEIDVSKLDLNR